ncbi:hypothetical protein M3Y99_00873300 [Aphelenchoides fujianensis]|nr:hypothetical protein M3Y99_00873300 [Aphelenchoides fujianensis]
MRSINSAKIQAHVQRVREWFQAERVVFQTCVLVFCAGYLLSQISFLYDAFSLTPSSVFVFHVWRPVTACFMEGNPLLLAWSILTLHQFIHIIEPVWGLNEVLKFTLITQLISTLAISFLGLASFAAFNSLDFFYYANLNGIASLSAGALVAVKQFLPDSVIFTTTRGRLKNTHLPLTAWFLLLLLSFFGLVRGAAVLQTAVGIQVSWTYLRFFQRRAINETVGDDSEHFSWPTLFPRAMMPAAKVVGNATYRALVGVKLLRKMENVILPSVVDQSTIELDADCEAERKRQIALRELQARLMQQQRNSRASTASPQPPAHAQQKSKAEPIVEHHEDDRILQMSPVPGPDGQ